MLDFSTDSAWIMDTLVYRIELDSVPEFKTKQAITKGRCG